MTRPPSRVAATASCLFLALGCATSPLGRNQLLLLPDSQMTAMGIAAFSELKSNKPVSSDHRAAGYVRCVAGAVTAALPRPGSVRAWEVTLFEDDSANAFALPGGKIGVHTGLLEVARGQDQLAAVIGHEVGHVLAKHANERMSTSTLAEIGLAAIDSSTGLSHQAMSLLGLGAQVGVLLPYSRAHETEADLIGMDLMARAGFDPGEAIKLWKNMAHDRDGAPPPAFLSTHPADQTRINSLRRRLPSARNLYKQALAAGTQPRCKSPTP